jgi:hypothetical protein
MAEIRIRLFRSVVTAKPTKQMINVKIGPQFPVNVKSTCSYNDKQYGSEQECVSARNSQPIGYAWECETRSQIGSS